jgi:hypothetical protein
MAREYREIVGKAFRVDRGPEGPCERCGVPSSQIKTVPAWMVSPDIGREGRGGDYVRSSIRYRLCADCVGSWPPLRDGETTEGVDVGIEGEMTL